MATSDIYHIDFAYNQDKLAELDVRAATRPTRLTDNPGDDRYPRVSPNGNFIAYSAIIQPGNDKLDVYVMGIGGNNRTRFTGYGSNEAPTWSLDNKNIVYSSNRNGDYDLYTVNVGYPGADVLMADNNTDDQWPIWAQ